MDTEDISAYRNISIKQILGLPDRGRDMMIRCPCPGHNDGTPSFSLRKDNSYYCFGCGVRGSGAVSFIMDATECSFQEALQELKFML